MFFTERQMRDIIVLILWIPGYRELFLTISVPSRAEVSLRDNH